MDKQFSVKFKLDPIILALIYICYKYKFPAAMMLSFYEEFGKKSLFILKAMTCAKKITLNDNQFIKIIEESKLLHKQLLSGITINMKRNKLENMVKNGMKIKEQIPDKPHVNLTVFSDDYSEFIENYLQYNLDNMFSEEPALKLNTTDLYSELK